MSAAFASQVVGLSGIGKFSAIDLGKKMAGKAVRVNAAIGEGWEHPPADDPWLSLAPGAVARVHPQ